MAGELNWAECLLLSEGEARARADCLHRKPVVDTWVDVLFCPIPSHWVIGVRMGSFTKCLQLS